MNIKHLLILAGRVARIPLLAMAIVAVTPAMAQRGGGKREAPRDITQIVSDLSVSQKKKLDAINEDSKARVGVLRARQKAVRDSIAMYIHRDGDQSKVLYPLFEREAQIQCNISREMYSTKLKIDAVLTPEQRRQVRDAYHKTSR